MNTGIRILKNVLADGVRTLGSRPVYLFGIFGVPLFMCVFFITLLSAGLPVRVPTAVVDLDHSPMSREIIRSLKSEQLVNVTDECESFDKAMSTVRSGKTYGAFIIPANFESDAISGREPTIQYYMNMTYFVPGTFSYKGYKVVAVTATAAVASSKAVSLGVPRQVVSNIVQPETININPIHNPWADYAVYMTPSFVSGSLALMIILMTIFSITIEIKNGSSPEWLRRSDGSILLALFGKLAPQTLLFFIVGMCIESLMFCYAGFPMHGSYWVMGLAMFLFVLANQGFGVFVTSILPNPRMALSVGALLSILAFSFTGFSFPVEQMYGAVGIFSYIMPVRYFFLIYVSNALDGFDIYYSRMCFVALILFFLAGFTMLWRLKKALARPVYVP